MSAATARPAAASGAPALPSGVDRPLKSLLGSVPATRLKRAFGHETVGDLLGHYPRRYTTRGELTPLGELKIDESVTVVALIVEVTGHQTAGRMKSGRPGHITNIVISDGMHDLRVTFFNMPWLERDLHRGDNAIFSGTVSMYKGRRQLAQPNVEVFEDGEIDPEVYAKTVIPLYPATASISSKQMHELILAALDSLDRMPDPVPVDVRDARGLMTLDDAVRQAHLPPTVAAGYAAQKTLKWHEAFVLQAHLLGERERMRAAPATARVAGALLAGFDERLPFELTPDQASVGETVLAEVGSEQPMNRLVQGEVGSGKTLVALRAMLAVAESGGQSALIAPTEVLAAQHLRSIVTSLGPDLAASMHPVLLTGQMPASERKRALLAAATGKSRIVIGTHALLGDAVSFDDLGLVVIDEQHRFGVAQRETLRAKGVAPHTLVLTATPIPRTVAMTAFGDLDVSTIKTMPAGRSPIQSFVVEMGGQLFMRTWSRMAEEVARGHQAFVVCPAIDVKQSEASTGDEPDAEETSRPPITVAETLGRLRAMEQLAGRRIEPLTGAMPNDEKERTMREFAAGRIDVLVATTVIEVGVDVPNATMMVVLDADRFGVSQLHQLRGRVGRGTAAGLCMLVTGADEGTSAHERVHAVASTLDGFELAEVDLELRREGDVLGTVQSGARSSLRLLRVTRDGTVIAEARESAADVLAGDPDLARHPELAAAVARRLDDAAKASLKAA